MVDGVGSHGEPEMGSVPQDWSLKQALEFVSQQRPQISPNSGFMARLIRLEESLHGTKTVKARHLEPMICA